MIFFKRKNVTPQDKNCGVNYSLRANSHFQEKSRNNDVNSGPLHALSRHSFNEGGNVRYSRGVNCFFILLCLLCLAPACRREKPTSIPLVREDKGEAMVRSIEARYVDLYIPFGIISRELLFESSDSSITQLRYQVASAADELRSAYLANMDAHGWVLKCDIDGNPKILFFKKPDASCFVYMQSMEQNQVCIHISLQKEK